MLLVEFVRSEGGEFKVFCGVLGGDIQADHKEVVGECRILVCRCGWATSSCVWKKHVSIIRLAMAMHVKW